ncbi:7-carboxy-7-deazaguanine synthase QueE [Planctobacterium marinum]
MNDSQRINITNEVTTQYKINEIFESIQGEGAFTGVPSIFIRVQGCPVGCPWCDTKHTWDIPPETEQSASQVLLKSSDSDTWFRATAEQLLNILREEGYTAKHIILTGGEPCLYNLVPLTSLLIENDYSVQIETSGTFALKTHPDTWVTVSPKINMKGGYEVRRELLEQADEIKHPIAMEKHIEELDELLAGKALKSSCLIYLQPISQQQRATELAVKTCIERNWRLSLQTHKFIGIE